jgi:hypothetical protein
MRDQHIAQVSADEFAVLPHVARETTREGDIVDFAFPFGDAEAGRINIYANAIEPVFQDSDFWIRLGPSQGNVLYVSFVGARQAQLGAEGGEGHTVLSGFDPTKHNTPAAQDFVFIRCV